MFTKLFPRLHVVKVQVTDEVLGRRYRSPRWTVLDSAPVKHPRPVRVHEADAGYDLSYASVSPMTLVPGGRATVSAGVSVDLDPATTGLILPRSGNASKLGLNVMTGVVDAGYDGEIKVTLHNTSDKKIVIEPGMKIAQMVVVPVVNFDAPAREHDRGEGGFGSTDEDTAEDMVNSPRHYAMHPVFQGECYTYAKWMTFSQGNAFKYLWRCAQKDEMRENIEKARWYLQAMVDGPHDVRKGSRLDARYTDQLEADLDKVLESVDRDNAPDKLLAALACYSAASCVAAGAVSFALELTKRALEHLGDVE